MPIFWLFFSVFIRLFLLGIWALWPEKKLENIFLELLVTGGMGGYNFLCERVFEYIIEDIVYINGY